MPLRVRLDHCDERDGVCWFRGTRLSGVGVEVVANGSDARPGIVRLWDYAHGLRQGPWLEPDLGGDQRVLMHWTEMDEFAHSGLDGSEFWEYESEGFFHFDGSGFNGGVVFFDGSFLFGIQQLVDGHFAGSDRLAYWSNEGRLTRYVDWHVLPWGHDALRVKETVRVGPRWNAAGVQETLVVDFALGDPAMSEAGRFEPYGRDHERGGRAWRFLVAKDANGQVCDLANIGGDGFFDIGEQVKGSVYLRGGHPLELVDFAAMAIAPVFKFSMSEPLVWQIFDALGGSDALSGVHSLRVIQSGCSSDLVAFLCSLQSLKRLDLPDQPTAELAADLVAELQPDRRVLVTFHNGQKLPA